MAQRMKSVLIGLVLAAQLLAPVAQAFPRLVEICSAHGVRYALVADRGAEASASCGYCLAVCDAAAACASPSPQAGPARFSLSPSFSETRPAGLAACVACARDPPFPV